MAVPALWRAPPGVSPPTLSLSLEKLTPIAQPEFLVLGARIFDLLVQPIVFAENWSNTSPVCDSFTPPIRISIGFV